MLAASVIVESTDINVAIDSIAAIFAIPAIVGRSRHAFIVVSAAALAGAALDVLSPPRAARPLLVPRDRLWRPASSSVPSSASEDGLAIGVGVALLVVVGLMSIASVASLRHSRTRFAQ